VWYHTYARLSTRDKREKSGIEERQTEITQTLHIYALVKAEYYLYTGKHADGSLQHIDVILNPNIPDIIRRQN